MRPIVHQEARRLGIKPVRDQLDNAGWARFRIDDPTDLLGALGRLRTVHRLGVILAEGKVNPTEPWEELDGLVDTIAVADWFGGGPFAVRGHRTGEHEFTSMDVAAHVGGALHDHLEAELGHRPAVDLEAPDAILRAHVDDDGHTRLWLDLAGQAGLHRRGYRAYDHPAGMKTSLAAALLELADRKDTGTFADPMAGGGTLPIEAAWRSLDAACPRLRGRDLLAWNAPVLAEHREQTVASWSRRLQVEDARPIVLGDHAPNHVEGARANLQRAGLEAIVDTYVGDVEELPKHVQAAQMVAANPPYGIRSGEGPLEETYARLMQAAGHALGEKGCLGLMTPKADLVERLAEEQGMRVKEKLEVRHGRLTIALLVVEP